MNPITLIDGYKFSHLVQYPSGTTKVYSNWTPRESRVPGIDHVTLFGLRYFLDKYLGQDFGAFFASPVDAACERYQRRVDGYLGPNNVGTEHIRALHELQYLPLEVRALPEGTAVPLRVPMLTVENTHPDFAWLTNYLETLMSSVLWMPCTSATTAVTMRKVLDAAAKATGSPADFVQWQGHDFSFRGMPGPEAAALSGAGHLLSFTGTDTLPSLDLIEDYYGPLPDGYLLGASVPATEHSVMCAGGELSELETFDRLLTLYPSGIVSVVSDTWDLWSVCTRIVSELKERIMARDGKLVIRPDSGDPADIVCGDPKAEPGSPASKGVIELLWDVFGGTVTSTGHRLLDSHIGCIYGDSITIERARNICERLAAKGFASANMVFGVGSFCVSPETPILCSDLVWRAAGELRVGQEILAFDENATIGEDQRAARRYRKAEITENSPSTKVCSRITTDIGDPIVASDDHPWLVFVQNRNSENRFVNEPPPDAAHTRDYPRNPGLAWLRTSQLRPGDKIAFLDKPWSEEDTRSAGWLAGMLDGEGCLSRQSGDRISAYKVTIAQNQGPVLERLKTELTARGFTFYANESRDCVHLTVLGGWTEQLRLLGTIRPDRLCAKVSAMLDDAPALKCNATYQTAIVLAVESVGEAAVASITTSCGTFITGGYLSHNTYQHVTRDTFGFAMKATWCEVNGEARDIFKMPKTGNGMKNSAKGRLAVLRGDDGELKLVSQATPQQESDSLLRPVWRDGSFLIRENFADIRSRVLAGR
jgi:nicotinamide phosphoribosyltransferase